MADFFAKLCQRVIIPYSIWKNLQADAAGIRMKRLISMGFAMVALLTIVACGSPIHSSSSSVASLASRTATPTTLSTAQASKNYLAIVAPANSALGAFSKTASSWTNSTTSNQMESDAEPLISTLRTTDSKLLAATWPDAQTTADIHSLVNADGALIGDLLALSALNLLNVSTWESTFERDATVTFTAADTARSDLGLPSNS